MAEKTQEQLDAEEKAKKEAEEKEKAEAEKKKKIKFSPEQTEFINTLFNQGFSEGAKKAEEAAKALIEEEKKQREALAAQLEELKKKAEPPKEPKTDPQIEQFRAQMEEMKTVLGGLKQQRDQLQDKVEKAEAEGRRARKKDAFLRAMKEADVDFFDPLEAYNLAEGMGYDWDAVNDRPVVINPETGRPKLNQNGESMTAIDFVKDFAEKKKYLVKAPADGGTGGSQERRIERGKEKDQKSFADMTDSEFDEYTQQVLNKR